VINESQFRISFPEFKSASDALITACLARAESQIDPEVYGDLTDEAHGLNTAHILSLSPNGQMARLTSDKSKSTYGVEFTKLREQATALLSRVP
jgi:hypothetical protein